MPRPIQALILLFAVVFQAAAIPAPFGRTSWEPAADVPSSCRCCECGGASCCEAPPREPRSSTPLVPARRSADPDLLSPPALARESETGARARPVEIVRPVPSAARPAPAAPLFVFHCSFLN